MSAGPGAAAAPPPAASTRSSPRNAADTDALSQVIADAFHDLPQSQWLIPDPDARQRILPGYFRILVEHALATGTVHTTTDRAAAALWIPISPEGASPPDDYAARLAALTGPWAGRFTAFDAALDRHHPAGFAHHHLAILAVHPDRQGQGIGSALLRGYHDILDRGLNLPAYLEAAQWRTRQLYRRHGYLPSGPFYLPDGGPPMFPMARPPQQRPATAVLRTRPRNRAARHGAPAAPGPREHVMNGNTSQTLQPASVRGGHPGREPARLPCLAAERSPAGGAVAADRPVAGDCAALPQVASAYAAYLYARTGVLPGTSAGGDQAHVSVRTQGRLLLLTFRCRNGNGQKWALSSAELSCGQQVTTFGCGQLRRMAAALLGP